MLHVPHLIYNYIFFQMSKWSIVYQLPSMSGYNSYDSWLSPTPSNDQNPDLELLNPSQHQMFRSSFIPDSWSLVQQVSCFSRSSSSSICTKFAPFESGHGKQKLQRSKLLDILLCSNKKNS